MRKIVLDLLKKPKKKTTKPLTQEYNSIYHSPQVKERNKQ